MIAGAQSFLSPSNHSGLATTIPPPERLYSVSVVSVGDSKFYWVVSPTRER
jgi:hypothetical protein